MPGSSPFSLNLLELSTPAHNVMAPVAWNISPQMVRIYYLPSHSRSRGAYSVLDANLEELMQSELKIVQTLVQFMGFPSPEVQRTAISALHMLRRHGGSQLPSCEDVPFIPLQKSVLRKSSRQTAWIPSSASFIHHTVPYTILWSRLSAA